MLHPQVTQDQVRGRLKDVVQIQATAGGGFAALRADGLVA